MPDQSFFNDPRVNLMHAQLALLLVNSLIIYSVGREKFLATLHLKLKIFAGIVIGASFAWVIASSFILPPSGPIPRWILGTNLTLVGLFCGITFYCAKVHRPVLYGSLEILAGACGLVIVSFLGPITSVLVLVFGYASSVYVIVRGLTNINDALLKPSEPPPAEHASASSPINRRRRMKVPRSPVRKPPWRATLRHIR